MRLCTAQFFRAPRLFQHQVLRKVTAMPLCHGSQRKCVHAYVLTGAADLLSSIAQCDRNRSPILPWLDEDRKFNLSLPHCKSDHIAVAQAELLGQAGCNGCIVAPGNLADWV